MGNLLSYNIHQGWLMNANGYNFNHHILTCTNTKCLTIFYKYNNENNKIILNSFLETISKGLLLHADDKHIAFINLQYHGANFVIFYALYEKNIYEYLKSICSTYTFIDKDPNNEQYNDHKYTQFIDLRVHNVPTVPNFSQKYLVEFIYCSLNLYDNPHLYNMCKSIKLHLYDSYMLNRQLFIDKLIRLMELKYDVISLQYDRNAILSIVINDIVTLQSICKSSLFVNKSQRFLTSIKIDYIHNNNDQCQRL